STTRTVASCASVTTLSFPMLPNTLPVRKSAPFQRRGSWLSNSELIHGSKLTNRAVTLPLPPLLPPSKANSNRRLELPLQQHAPARMPHTEKPPYLIASDVSLK